VEHRLPFVRALALVANRDRHGCGAGEGPRRQSAGDVALPERRVSTPENEERMLLLAYTATAAQVERVARAWRRCDRLEEARDSGRRHLARSVSTYVDEDGKDAAAPDNTVEEVNWAQRRADALGLLAECALQTDLDRGSAGDRYPVVLPVDTEDVRADAGAVLELEDGGIRVSAETSRRLSCDASVVAMREAPDGSVLDVGRRTRTVPTPMRRALTARDARCRFPGCTARRCDAHHIEHWADGGSTSLDNLMLVCRRHHTLVHEGGIRVERDALGGLNFVRPDGRVIALSPPRPAGCLRALPDNGSAKTLPCWDGTRFNLGYVIDVLRTPPSVSEGLGA
jgi:hypothetical protein